MPPKARIAKDMIINAAIEIAKQRGYESINARTVSEQLHCSTQPVMYHFSTIDAMKRAAYAKVNHLHSEYLMTIVPKQHPILGIGLNYIRFAVEEPQLFRFLFQSGYAQENSLQERMKKKETQYGIFGQCNYRLARTEAERRPATTIPARSRRE